MRTIPMLAPMLAAILAIGCAQKQAATGQDHASSEATALRRAETDAERR
jgi:hypothetical protein